MNKLQQVEFDILKKTIEVCEKLNLKYYLVCGSALGAVKYGGFIPWDDDIDIALPRPDYELFLNKAPSLLPNYYFLQNYRSDKYFHLIGSKIRDSRTTYIEKMCDEIDIHHGVFIDVFPLDGDYIIKNNYSFFINEQKKIESIRRVRLKLKRFTSREIFNIRFNLCYLMFKLFGMYGETSKYMEKYEKIISCGNVYESERWCNHANSISPKEYAPQWHYGEGIDAWFEGIKVKIPENYDAYLTQKYGDWRREIPKNQQVGHHYYEVYDLSRPYTDYIQSLPKGKSRIKKEI